MFKEVNTSRLLWEIISLSSFAPLLSWLALESMNSLNTSCILNIRIWLKAISMHAKRNTSIFFIEKDLKSTSPFILQNLETENTYKYLSMSIIFSYMLFQRIDFGKGEHLELNCPCFPLIFYSFLNKVFANNGLFDPLELILRPP